jgi:thiol-disulfide isomerase/thioredoxin
MIRKALLILVMVVGITLLIWAGVENSRNRKLAEQKAEAGKALLIPDQPGSGAQAGPEPQHPSLEGKPAPAFTLVDLDGKKVSLADFKGKPVLVNFWATWCAPCKLEMPWFEEFRHKYAAQNLVILGIADDDVSKDEIAKSAKKTGVTYPILLTDGKIDDIYGGIEMLPTSFYVGKDGVVVEETTGLGGKDEVESNIRKLIAAGGQ